MHISRLLTVATFVCACTLAPSLGMADSDPAGPSTPAAAVLPDAPIPQNASSSASQSSASSAAQSSTLPAPESNEGKQTKRILGIVPNFRSVSANQKLPAQSAKEKVVSTLQDSFDYSAITFSAAMAGVAQAQDSYPEFHQGAAGYGRYFWHTFADQTNENFWVEGIMPVALHQDTRYYTLGHGGVLKRGAYSFTRVLVTRGDDQNREPNYSEVVGAGIGSSISSLYYPSAYRTWTKIGQRWLTNVIIDGCTLSFKEFWPDVNNAVFHQKD
jgi:hypothetical protein